MGKNTIINWTTDDPDINADDLISEKDYLIKYGLYLTWLRAKDRGAKTVIIKLEEDEITLILT